MTDRFLRACRRGAVDRTPVWIMRQAGRYLPEYRALRERVDFLTLCRTPELAVEATLQPLRRFPLDAAILFSDILLPLQALGVQMDFTPGPAIAQPLRTRAQVEALTLRPAEEAVPFVAEAVRLLRRELDGRTPLIGFCGAPWTLACYLVQGRGKEGFGATKTMLYREPATLEHLLSTLATGMIDYLMLQ
ncbi:MAG TPA: uroporphyrinogen decarboxylase family protein, partial [Vicinamibacterales bacterium]|nr:uroporphyrinogen decarboxylase family protein [Vicinamibacterales bacterium]